MPHTIITQTYHSPIGTLLLGSYGQELCLCEWTHAIHRATTDRHVQHTLRATYQSGQSEILTRATMQLNEYFAGTRQVFSIPLLFAGTDFQTAVWNQLQQIPYGTTLTYSQQATYLHRSQATRAVAQADGANAIAILVPCHRVIGQHHQLGGYNGGTDIKRWLLEWEAKHTPTKLFREKE